MLQNVLEGDAIDVLKFPVPLHHEKDKARYIGTACCVMTQDPDSGWFNLGAYRSQVYDRNTVGCQITEGKHGRIHRDKNFERGKPMKVAIVCGQDPLLFLLASSPLPEISELDIAGGLRGEPIDVIRGPYTGFPIPADAEIVLEGETVPGQVRPEGPFGEWMGYYSDDTQPRPYVNVKIDPLSQRSDPVLRAAAQAGGRDRAAQGRRRRRANLERARRLRRAGSARRVEPRSRSGDALHRHPDQAALSRPRAAGAARRRRLPGRRLCRQVDGGGGRGHRRRRARPGAVGDVHAVRSERRHRHHPEGLGLEARSAVPARQLQQPHPDRRLHPLRHEAQGHVPDRGRRRRRPARASCGPSSRTSSRRCEADASSRDGDPCRHCSTIRPRIALRDCVRHAGSPCAASPMPAHAQSVADFYKGKTITLAISFSARRRLRSLRPRIARAPHGQAHPGQSHDRAAEHAGRRRHCASRSISIRRGAEGRR